MKIFLGIITTKGEIEYRYCSDVPKDDKDEIITGNVRYIARYFGYSEVVRAREDTSILCFPSMVQHMTGNYDTIMIREHQITDRGM